MHVQDYNRGRQDAYLDFLGHVPATSPRRQRHGLYSSHTFGKPPHQVRVIFLVSARLVDGALFHLPPASHTSDLH